MLTLIEGSCTRCLQYYESAAEGFFDSELVVRSWWWKCSIYLRKTTANSFRDKENFSRRCRKAKHGMSWILIRLVTKLALTTKQEKERSEIIIAEVQHIPRTESFPLPRTPPEGMEASAWVPGGAFRQHQDQTGRIDRLSAGHADVGGLGWAEAL